MTQESNWYKSLQARDNGKHEHPGPFAQPCPSQWTLVSVWDGLSRKERGSPGDLVVLWGVRIRPSDSIYREWEMVGWARRTVQRRSDERGSDAVHRASNTHRGKGLLIIQVTG